MRTEGADLPGASPTGTDPDTLGMPGVFGRYRPDIAPALREGLPARGVQLYDMLRYYMGWVDAAGAPCAATEGKALRPTLCLLACEATGGTVRQSLPAAVALEFIHNFSLIHDDIQDRDETRHHRATLWAIWGVPKAVVAGNALRVVADICLERLVDEGIEVAQALRVTGLLTKAYLEMIEGQYLDISYEGRHDIGIDDYLGMISRKTGALIRCAVDMGAALGTNDEQTLATLHRFGASLGYAFQIRDDYLGVWGEEETTGKPVGADIRRKKNSFPLVYAMSSASGEDREVLRETYEKEQLSDEDVETVLEMMDRMKVAEVANRLATDHCETALHALNTAEIDPDRRREAEALVNFLVVRQH